MHLTRLSVLLRVYCSSIDEIDAIIPRQESAQREMKRHIVAHWQFLTCMDGIFTSFFSATCSTNLTRTWEKTEDKPVIVMTLGATNRPTDQT
ncbi:hypothetical protein BDR03DRAFT_970869, partial [Suillus americanus]